MFGKLVKHEFRATARIIPFVYLVTIFLALVHIITSRFNLGTISKISLVLMVVMCFAQVAITFVLLIWRYYKNLYSNEGYLAQTLPVHPTSLLWSKLIVSFVWTLASYLVGAAVVAAVFLMDFVESADKFGALSKAYNGFLAVTGMTNLQPALWVGIAFFVVVSIVLLYAQMYFAITVGNLSKLHSLGIGGPILVYFGEYVALEIINTIVTLFVPLGIQLQIGADGTMGAMKIVFKTMFSNLGSTFAEANNSAAGNSDMIIGIGQYILLPILAVGLLLLTARIISRRTSIK